MGWDGDWMEQLGRRGLVGYEQRPPARLLVIGERLLRRLGEHRYDGVEIKRNLRIRLPSKKKKTPRSIGCSTHTSPAASLLLLLLHSRSSASCRRQTPRTFAFVPQGRKAFGGLAGGRRSRAAAPISHSKTPDSKQPNHLMVMIFGRGCCDVFWPSARSIKREIAPRLGTHLQKCGRGARDSLDCRHLDLWVSPAGAFRLADSTVPEWPSARLIVGGTTSRRGLE